MTDRLIRITTALAVVAVVAAVISYQHAYELVRSHGESGVTARLLPFTVDGLIWAASMVVLDASRRAQPVPRLAAWSLGAGIAAIVADDPDFRRCRIDDHCWHTPAGSVTACVTIHIFSSRLIRRTDAAGKPAALRLKPVRQRCYCQRHRCRLGMFAPARTGRRWRL